MARIQVLPDIVIHQIAAGEVAERPATIIKELIENALDAQATQIKIEAELGRHNRITVSDNGLGMAADDLALSPLRHATSKIDQFEDLQSLATFGFRGEALASIAFASRLTIMSRPPSLEAGHAITVENNQISHPRPVGMAAGTVVVVENLFDHLPVRKKFLKSPAIELKQMTEVVVASALAYPQVGFIFEYQHKRQVVLPPNQDLLERSAELYHLNISEDMLPLTIGEPPLQLSGWIGKPHAASYSHRKQLWLINARPIQQSPLYQLVKDSYGSLIDAKSEPSFVLQLQLPPALIDVNVHPHKDQVALSQEADIMELVTQSIKQHLADHDVSYNLAGAQPPSATTQTTVTNSVTDLQPQTQLAPVQPQLPSWQPGQSVTDEGILQIDRTYLVYPTAQGFKMMDQHAAHERILFEEFLSQLGREPLLLEPAAVVHPTRLELTIFATQQPKLSQLGFQAESFGQDTLKLTQVPALLQGQSPRQMGEVFLEVLDEVQTSHNSKTWEEIQRQILSSMACHEAVRAGDYLTPTQRQELITKLNQVPNSATCPHGRPTTISVSLKELAKLFKRQK